MQVATRGEVRNYAGIIFSIMQGFIIPALCLLVFPDYLFTKYL